MTHAQNYLQVSQHFQVQRGLKLLALADPQPNENVLDVGCGTGTLTYEFAQKVLPNGKVVAIDPDRDRIAIAQKNAPLALNNITWLQQAAEKSLPDPQLTFDLAASNFVFHWLAEPAKKTALKIIYNALSHGGRFALQVLQDWPELTKEVVTLQGDAGPKIFDSLYFMPADQWRKLLTDTGFRIIKEEQADDYHFDDLNQYLIWFEGTMNGAFQASRIPAAELNKLQKRYPGKITIYSKETLLLLTEKI